jgi:iron(III) transport system substrate-binding protein
MGLSLLTSACAGAQAPAKTTSASTEVDGLVRAAKTEGALTFYSASPDNPNRKIAEAFQNKYGIKTEYVRLSSNVLQQRFATEADSGKVVADVIITGGNTTAYGRQGMQKGWIEPITSSSLPVIADGTFPKNFVHEVGAVTQIQPWLFSYNKKLIKEEDLPRTWLDLADPRYNNMLILPDPRTSEAYFDVFDLLLQRYGDEYFLKLKANNFKLSGSGATSIQALGAGEAALMGPTGPNVYSLADQGAPVGIVQPDLTVGVELEMLMTARSKAPHPNAGRLFANYVLSDEGNKIFSSDPGNVSAYDNTLPKEYHSPSPEGVKSKEKILGLLGIARS